ncbi:uncharacterized protein LOC121390252 [Gigantopelta aegis]|uniref:uncharacterized protein LOC121390252 n=1 Tax=Gigantopelta aegis TaxID=1735272 RepID=UPI001B88D0EE|nr:uncharacterized protein LOC121390252 [Gigantopelta aegis]
MTIAALPSCCILYLSKRPNSLSTAPKVGVWGGIVTFSEWLEAQNGVAPPGNLTALAIRANSATLGWIVYGDGRRILRFEITYDLVDSPIGKFRVTRAIDGYRRYYKLSGLFAGQTYRVFMVSLDISGTTSNISNELKFTTEPNDGRGGYLVVRHGTQAEEVVVFLILIMVWIVAVTFFFKKWDSIRILQPMEPRYKHSPKNLETIRIVKRAQDSIIYKNYSRKLSLTMFEREKKRLARLNTVPQINTLPIQMEEMTTEM